MAWVTWRQHRAALAGFGVLFGGLALAMLGIGLRAHYLYAAMVRGGCYTGADSGIRCSHLVRQFRVQPLYFYPNGIAVVLHVVPVLIGAFLGAPLLAREFETGTFRFAWTQGTACTRWTAAKLALLAAMVTATACGLAALAAWSVRQFGLQSSISHWTAAQFDTTLATIVGWTLLAFALGVFAGTLIKRTVPAMAATVACSSALALAALWKLDYILFGFRPLEARLVSPGALVNSAGPLNRPAEGILPGPAGSWIVRGWYTGPSGQRLSSSAVDNLYRRLATVNGTTLQPLLRWLSQHHYTFWVAYQPASRYWLFQFIECGTLVLLALTLAVATVSLVRHRA
jgi:hypothetical protein